MSDRVIIVQLGSEEEKAPADKRAGSPGQDVWRFKEIRETLWGTGKSAKGSKGIWDFSGIRKKLWGR